MSRPDSLGGSEELDAVEVATDVLKAKGIADLRKVAEEALATDERVNDGRASSIHVPAHYVVALLDLLSEAEARAERAEAGQSALLKTVKDYNLLAQRLCVAYGDTDIETAVTRAEAERSRSRRLEEAANEAHRRLAHIRRIPTDHWGNPDLGSRDWPTPEEIHSAAIKADDALAAALQPDTQPEPTEETKDG